MSVATTDAPTTTALGTPAAPPEGGQTPPAGQTPPGGGTPPAAEVPAWIPDAYKGEKVLHAYKTQDDALKGLVETKRLVGASVRLPGADAKPEEWDAFHAKLRPAKPEDYALEVTPEDGWDDEFSGWFKTTAHDLGLTPRQAQLLAAKVTEHSAPERQALTDTVGQYESTLKGEFGQGYTAKVEHAVRFLQQHGSADEVAALNRELNKTGLGSHPVLVRALAAAGASVAEHPAPIGAPGGGGMSLEEAKGLISNAKSAYHDPSHADHVRVKREVDAAYARAYPGKLEAS